MFLVSSHFPGLLPVVSVGVNQVGRLNLGRQVDSLQYFTVCGLQEGYEPFAVNMSKDPALWISWKQPQFTHILPDDHKLQVGSCIFFRLCLYWTEGCVWHWLIHTDPYFVNFLLKVTKVSGSVDSPSNLRVSHRLFGHHSGGSDMGFYRLSMSVECAAILTSPAGGVLPLASNVLSPG